MHTRSASKEPEVAHVRRADHNLIVKGIPGRLCYVSYNDDHTVYPYSTTSILLLASFIDDVVCYDE